MTVPPRSGRKNNRATTRYNPAAPAIASAETARVAANRWSRLACATSDNNSIGEAIRNASRDRNLRWVSVRTPQCATNQPTPITDQMVRYPLRAACTGSA